MALIVLFFLTTLAPLPTANVVIKTDLKREARVNLYKEFANNRLFRDHFNPTPPGDTVTMDIAVTLLDIVEIVESKQTIETNLYFHCSYKDEALAWSSENFGNITSIRLPGEMVWRPSLSFISSANNDANKNSDPDYVMVDSTGSVSYMLSATAVTLCNFDLLYFPVDRQNCYIPVEVHGYDVEVEVKATLRPPELMRGERVHTFNGEWTTLNVSLSCHESAESTTYVTLEVDLQRKAEYYVACVLLPMAVTAMASLLVFWIPPSFGERMTYLEFVHVCTALYVCLVGYTVPKNSPMSGETTRMSCFLLFTIAQTAATSAATIFVRRRYHEEKEKLIFSPSSSFSNSASQDLTPLDDVKKFVENHAKSLWRFVSKRVSGSAKGREPRKLSTESLDMLFFISFLMTSTPFYVLIFLV